MTDGGRRLQHAAQRLSGHHTKRVILTALATGLGLAMLLLAALLLFDRFAPGAGAPRGVAWLPLAVRAAGLLAVVVLPLVWLGRAVFSRLPALRNLEEAARRTESQDEGLKDRIVPALQVLRTRDEERTGYSPDLVDAVVDRTAGDVEAVQPQALPYNVDLRKSLRWAAAGAAALAGVGVFLGADGFGRGLAQLASAAGELGPQPAIVIAVEPGNVSVPRGESVNVAARVEHARPDADGVAGAFEWRTGEDQPWRRVELLSPAERAGEDVRARFEHELTDLREDVRYRFVHAEAVSEEFGVTAVPRPSLTIESVTYRYPEYTGLPDREVQDGSGDLAALRGSVAEIVVRCTNDPVSGTMEFDDGEVTELAVAGERRLAGELLVEGERTYRLHVEDTLGLTNPNPLEYRVRALADEAPFIRLLEPGEDRDLDESMQATLRFSAVDDYGLGPVKLVWEVSRREGEASRRVVWTPPADAPRTEAADRVEWDLGDMDLLPGDTVTYHLEVSDNNTLDGPRTARTRDYVFRFPTMAEIFAEMDDQQESSVDDLGRVVEEARKVEEKVQEISREMLKQGDSSWENRKELERALEQQQQLSQELQRVQEEVEQGLQDLQESEFATLEAVQKMDRIRQLLDEVMNTEMRETLEKLQRALEEANPRRQQDELADFQMDQEELMKQLDRIQKNLEQVRLEEKMRAAVREMEELAARQERVNDELAQLDREPSETEESNEADDASEAGEDDASDWEEGQDADGSESDGQDSENRDGDPSDSDSESADGSESESADDASEGEESPSSSESSESPESSESRSGESPESSESQDGDSPSSPEERQERLDQLAQEQESLAEEARRMEEQLRELAEMTQELRDSQSAQGMQELSEQMDSSDVPETMDEASEQMEQGQRQQAQEEGEKALTELRDILSSLQQQQQGMQSQQIAISQAAINRAVRDLLSLSGDEESLADALATLPRNSASSTRSFADEQFLLIEGAERVEDMLHEVAKDTPLMDSQVGRALDRGLESMKDAAHGLENGAVHIARDDGEEAVDELNAVVISLLQTSQSMSSCPSGMPMSDLLQQLQEMSGDQQKLNDALKQLMEQGGQSMDQRLQAQLDRMAQEQQRIAEQLQQMLEEMGSAQGLLGRLDDVSKKLDEAGKRLAEGDIDEDLLKDQAWALTRLLDSQRSMRERDLGKERQSNPGEDLADLLSPDALPEGLEELDRDLREDLLKALERRYPPKYEELIRRYFRSLSDEVPSPDLP